MEEKRGRIDLSRLADCIRHNYAEPAMIEDYIGRMVNSQETGRTSIEIKNILKQWATEGVINKSYNPLPNGRAETCYRPGKKWSQMMTLIQGTEKKQDT